mgnify:CR=1 FL=1
MLDFVNGDALGGARGRGRTGPAARHQGAAETELLGLAQPGLALADRADLAAQPDLAEHPHVGRHRLVGQRRHHCGGDREIGRRLAEAGWDNYLKVKRGDSKHPIKAASPMGEEKEMEVKGRDLVSGIPKTVRVHSAEIREAIQEPVQQIVDAVRRALEITPPELASDIVDRGIVMTGGGALIRGLDVLLTQETGLPIHVDEDPLTCVVRGCGMALERIEKQTLIFTSV